MGDVKLAAFLGAWLGWDVVVGCSSARFSARSRRSSCWRARARGTEGHASVRTVPGRWRRRCAVPRQRVARRLDGLRSLAFGQANARARRRAGARLKSDTEGGVTPAPRPARERRTGADPRGRASRSRGRSDSACPRARWPCRGSAPGLRAPSRDSSPTVKRRCASSRAPRWSTPASVAPERVQPARQIGKLLP